MAGSIGCTDAQIEEACKRMRESDDFKALSKPPPIASITITCAVLSVDTQWTSGGPVIRQYCRVQEITRGGIIERVPCFGLNLSPCDAITITVSKADA